MRMKNLVFLDLSFGRNERDRRPNRVIFPFPISDSNEFFKIRKMELENFDQKMFERSFVRKRCMPKSMQKNRPQRFGLPVLGFLFKIREQRLSPTQSALESHEPILI